MCVRYITCERLSKVKRLVNNRVNLANSRTILVFVFVLFSLLKDGTVRQTCFLRSSISIPRLIFTISFLFFRLPCFVRSFELATSRSAAASARAHFLARRRASSLFLAASLLSLSSLRSRETAGESRACIKIGRRNARRRNWLPTLLKSRSYPNKSTFMSNRQRKQICLFQLHSMSLYLFIFLFKKKTKRR